MKDQTQNAAPMTRADVTAQILTCKKARSLTWEAIAETIGLSPVFTHSACMGMNAFPVAKAQALTVALDLPSEAAAILSEPPTKI